MLKKRSNIAKSTRCCHTADKQPPEQPLHAFVTRCCFAPRFLSQEQSSSLGITAINFVSALSLGDGESPCVNTAVRGGACGSAWLRAPGAGRALPGTPELAASAHVPPGSRAAGFSLPLHSLLGCEEAEAVSLVLACSCLPTLAGLREFKRQLRALARSLSGC